MKVTGWFPHKIKPVRKGWYEVEGCGGFMDCAGMHHWDGKNWCFPEYQPMRKDDETLKLNWRGLTEEAK